MKRLITIIILSVLTAIAGITSCTHKTKVLPAPFSDGNYPADVAQIIINKCTYSGCHNAASYKFAAGLRLDTWQHMFEGSQTGAEVVAFSPRFSPLLYYCNAHEPADVSATYTGHLDTPLTLAEYNVLKSWIASGAPDKNGNIPFPTPSPDTRQKIYLTIQGCNLIAVIDAKSKLIMRYIHIGDALNKSPHDVEISADGMYAYVPFFGGNIVQKIDVHADTVIGSVNVASVVAGGSGGAWSIITLSPLDTAFIVSGWTGNGSVVAVNTATMTINQRKSADAINGVTSFFPYPHGLAANARFDTFITTLANGLLKYTFGAGGGFSAVKNIPASGQPHQIEMTPDGSKYFVTCPDTSGPTNFVRVYDYRTDTLIKAIQVGAKPQEMDLSPAKNYVLVACTEDNTNPTPNSKGSVYVIDYNTLAIVKVLYGDFYQPHDLTVDEQDGLIFIPSENANPSGPAPHHQHPPPRRQQTLRHTY
jgi:DNA-binding beta-propeller fold protein YncE